MLNPSSNGSTQRLGVQILQELIHNRPLAFWGGMWASLVLVAYVAALGLLSPGTIEGDKPQETTPSAKIVEESPIGLPNSDVVQSSQSPVLNSAELKGFQTPESDFTNAEAASPTASLPMWLFGAIALTCASGGLLIYGSLSQWKQRRKPLKRRAKSVKSSPTATVVRKQQSPSRIQRPKASKPSAQPPRPVAQTPLVTVLPPEENHPLDWGEDSLADMMDMRKQHSLTSLLRVRS